MVFEYYIYYFFIMVDKRKDPRINKGILVKNIPDSKIENLSITGGFICTDKTLGQYFNLHIHLNIYLIINIQCELIRKNSKGIGFRINKFLDGNISEYSDFIQKEISLSAKLSKDRVWRHEHFITVEETNVFGNMYFADFFKLQGIARDLMLLYHVQDIHQIMAETGATIAVVDAYNKFIKPCFFGENITIEISTKDIMRSRATLIINFRNKENNEMRGEGYQRFCWVSNTGKVMQLPPIFDFLSYYEQA